jgi:hypothetical protein
MGFGGPNPHLEWDGNPSQCPHISVANVLTDAYSICWHPQVCKPDESGSVDLNDVLCSPEHCPLTEKEREKFGISAKKCPKCGSHKISIVEIRDVAFSIHYIDNIADYRCSDCGHNWSEQYGYRGLA